MSLQQLFVFDATRYRQAIPHAVGFALVGFVLILIIWGSIVPADLLGMAIATPIIAYLIHLWIEK